MNHHVSIAEFDKKEFYSLGENFQGENPSGEQISFTNYYMKVDGKPFLA